MKAETRELSHGNVSGRRMTKHVYSHSSCVRVREEHYRLTVRVDNFGGDDDDDYVIDRR